MKTIRYPRLAIRRRSSSVLVTLSDGHRGFELRRFWVVIFVRAPGNETICYAGRDDGIIGWVDCVDWAHRTVKQASR